MKLTSAMLLIVILFGCSKPPSMSRATLFNSTIHDIKILFYQNGVVPTGDTIFMPSSSQFLLAYASTGRGSTTGIGKGFNANYYGDSVIVVFDNAYTTTHYVNPPLNLAKHYYLFDEPRNINNPNNYIFTVMHDDGTVNDHKYYFTEQDYLDAKD